MFDPFISIISNISFFYSNKQGSYVFEDNINDNDSPYNLRKNRRKNVKYQDYIKNDLVCRNCEKEFGNEKALDNHVKTCQITSFACSNCGKNYKTKWGLITHRKNMHSKIKRKKNIT